MRSLIHCSFDALSCTTFMYKFCTYDSISGYCQPQNLCSLLLEINITQHSLFKVRPDIWLQSTKQFLNHYMEHNSIYILKYIISMAFITSPPLYPPQPYNMDWESYKSIAKRATSQWNYISCFFWEIIAHKAWYAAPESSCYQ